MTVCIAGIFKWNYAANDVDPTKRDWGPAVLCLSDKMVTVGDIKYEPLKQKASHITDTTLILIAGDMTAHSQAIVETQQQVKRSNAISPFKIAQIYGQRLQQIRQREAEDNILSPLGLNSETFLAQQKEMSETAIDRLLTQLQDYPVEPTEAIVVGFDKDSNNPELYQIDQRGTARRFTDIGFAVIGTGERLSRTSLMSLPFNSDWNLPRALAALYSAKRLAEMNPSVGRGTDVSLITRNGTQSIWPGVVAKLDELRQRYQVETEKLTQAALEQLGKFFDDPESAPEVIASPPEKTGEDGEGNNGNP